MDIRTLRTEPYYKAAPARTVPATGYGTLLDDWSERAFTAFKHEPLRRRS